MTDPTTERDVMISRMQNAVSKPPEPPADKSPKKPMSAEEVRSKIEELARSGEGADQRWALRTLHAEESGAVTLPTPLTDAEVLERTCRIMKSAGQILSQLAYRQTFPKSKLGGELAPRMLLNDLPEHIREKAMQVTTLRILYRDFPDVKRPGMPPGYPQKSSLLARQEWCQRTAANLLLEQEQKKLDETPGTEEPL